MHSKKQKKQKIIFTLVIAALVVLIIPIWLFGWQKNIKQTLNKQIKNENLEQKNKQLDNLKKELENLKNAWNSGLMDLEKQIDGLDDTDQNDEQNEEKLKLPE